MHSYFKVVSLVSLYILSVEATWRILLVFKHVYVADPVTGFSGYVDRVGQQHRHHLFQFSPPLQSIHTHMEVYIATHAHTYNSSTYT